MSRRGRDGGATAGCTVTGCRGCCCGTAAGFDHAGQLTRLRTAVAGVAVVRVSDCLDTCAYANVIVVRPSPAGRSAGGRLVWLGLVNDTDEGRSDRPPRGLRTVGH